MKLETLEQCGVKTTHRLPDSPIGISMLYSHLVAPGGKRTCIEWNERRLSSVTNKMSAWKDLIFSELTESEKFNVNYFKEG